MKRQLIVAAVAVVALLGFASPANADDIPTIDRPCGALTLRIQHQASADWFDFNGDGVECWDTEYTEPGAGSPRDNLVPLAPFGGGYKFFSWGSDPKEKKRTEILHVNAKKNTFTAWTYGQEDDRDWRGCFGRCKHTLSYDTNDFFFIDRGHGSVRASLSEFESVLAPGLSRFSMYYQRESARKSIFSIEYPLS